MPTLVPTFLAALLLLASAALSGSASAWTPPVPFPAPVPKDPPKANPTDKLIGVWKLHASTDKLPEDAEVTVEFSGDGVLTLRVKVGKAVNSASKGTYKADGDKLHYTLDSGGGERKETLHIDTLTADKLVVIDPEKKREEFRRVAKK